VVDNYDTYSCNINFNSFLKVMIIALPLPPTDNFLRQPVIRAGRSRASSALNIRSSYGRQHVEMILTGQYRKWKEKCSRKWDKSYMHIPMLYPTYENQISIKYKIIMDSKRKDISNFEKAIKDFLSKRLYPDDKWVKMDLILPVTVDKDKAGIEIFIEE
jgi:Holliday junction resolvase RusA-like endonuclease